MHSHSSAVSLFECRMLKKKEGIDLGFQVKIVPRKEFEPSKVQENVVVVRGGRVPGVVPGKVPSASLLKFKRIGKTSAIW